MARSKSTWLGILYAALRMGYITEEEANQLLLYRVELEEYRKNEDEDLTS